MWMAREGHRILNEVRLLGTKPLRIDTRQFRLDNVQQAVLEEQIRFRQRSRERFPDVEKWLWTDRSLQQASDWTSALVKASLIATDIPVVDACCGAGADLVALAREHRVVGIDRDPRLARLALANVHAHQLSADMCIAELPTSLGDLSRVALHIDPDRRAGEDRSTRTTHGEAFSPSLAECMLIAQPARAAIIKLAPATEIDLTEQSSDWRRCWLGTPRECPQQLLLRGETNLIIPSGQVAAVLGRRELNRELNQELASEVYCGPQLAIEEIVTEPDAYVYEPHPAIYAAGLAPVWSSEHNLTAITNPRGYYTGPELQPGPWAQAFRVLEVIAWDDRRVRKWLRAAGAGRLEVKSRLITIDASELQRRYSQSEGRPLVCLLTRSGKGLRAIMAERTNL